MSDVQATALVGALRRFRPYPAYRDSGLEWLGKIPTHWVVRRLKTIASVELSNVDKKSVEGEEPVMLCNYVDVYHNEHITPELVFMPATATSEQVRRYALRRGDVLITKDSESWTDIAVPAVVASDLPNTLCGYHLALVRPGPDCRGPFLARAFSAIGPRDQFHMAANGITRFGLGGDAIRNGLFALPPTIEQSAIEEFLDRETAMIDALVAKKERLIRLLEERRAALITHAVTKGLDPTAPMRDSGVEWLGSIPSHWTPTRVRFLADRIVDGVHHTPEYTDDGIPFVTVKNLTSQVDGISFDDVNYITHEAHAELSRRANPRKGDLLLTKDGTLGVPRIVDTDRPFSIFVSVALLQLTRDKILPWYLRYVFESEATKEQFRSRSLGSALKHLHLEEIASIRVALPPIDEQEAIGGGLDDRLSRITALVNRVQDAIEGLTEYRTALISAAVTGKIDVREEVT